MPLDPTDIRLLEALQTNAQTSNAELSEIVHLSPSACHRRVRELERAGIITRYVALVDARKIDRKSVVFVEISLSGQSEHAFEEFEAAVAQLPNLLECHLMAGSADYLLKLIARDAEDFATIHRQYLSRLPQVANMKSSFALKTVFRTTALPIS